jgi:hypothetical protein
MLLVLFVPEGLGTHASYGTTGSFVAWGDSDYAPRFVSTAAAVVLRTDTGGAVQAQTYFLHFGPTSDTATVPGDVVLSGASKGAVVTTGTSGLKTAGAAFTAGLYWLEADGKPGYTPNDFVYWSSDATLNVLTGANDFADIRLGAGAAISPSNATTFTAGTVVNTTDTDITEATLSTNGILPDGTGLTALTAFLQYSDKDANGVQNGGSSADVYKLSAANATSRVFMTDGDIFMATSGGYTFGARVVASTTKEIPILTGVDDKAMLVATAPSANTSISDYKFYVHFRDTDNSNNTITMGDIQLAGSSMTFGTRVTTTATGYGETIICTNSPPTIQSLLYFVDKDGISGYSDADALYINVPNRCGFRGTSDTLLIDANDIRASSVPGASYTAGSLTVGTDSDVAAGGTTNPVTGRWYHTLMNEDLSNFVQFYTTELTNGKFYDVNGNAELDLGDAIYISSDAVVSTGDIRIYNGLTNSAQSPNGADSTTSTAVAVLGTDGDAVAALPLKTPKTYKKHIWVTGPDATFDAGKSEYIYASVDNILNAGDFRLLNITAAPVMTANSTVVVNARDTIKYGPGHNAERQFFVWCRAGQVNGTAVGCTAANVPLLLHINDVELVSGGTRVSATSTDHVPWLQMFRPREVNQTLLRYNRLDTSSVVDDTFYMGISPAGATTLQNRHVRITGYDSSNPSGRTVNANTAETGASAGEIVNASVVFRQQIRFIDTDANGYDSGDFVVLDNPAATGGSNVGTYGFGDIRLSPTGSTAGASASPAGTIRINGDPDVSFTAFAQTAGGKHFHVYTFDATRNNDTDFETRGHDRLYAMYSTTDGVNGGDASGNASETNPITPLINSVRLIGAGGATAPTGTATATAAATTATTATTGTTGTTTASSGATSGTTSTTTSGVSDTASSGATNGTTSKSPTKTKPKTPGFELAGAAVATLVAAVVIMERRRRKD